MELTAAAQWLNTSFAGFDNAILEFYHNLAEVAAPFFTPFFTAISFVGDGGMLGFVLAFILLLFKKTRKWGFCIIAAIGIGGLITNITLKDIIARPRPFNNGYEEWWKFIGAPIEDEFSFPSGHATAAAAAMTALCIWVKPKWIIAPASVYVLLIMASRNYLMVHYPSDVTAGLIVGMIAGTCAFFITVGVFKLLEKLEKYKFFSFVLNFDIINLFRKKEAK